MLARPDIEQALRHYGDALFPVPWSAYLAARGRVAWGLLIDAGARRFDALFGDMTTDDLRQFNTRFCDTVAGYKVGARDEFPALSANADVFLLARDGLEFSRAEVDALIVHELCHWYLDAGLQTSHPVPVDSTDRIKARLLHRRTDIANENATRHTVQFCRVLCAVAQRAAGPGNGFVSRHQVVELAMRFDVSGGFRR